MAQDFVIPKERVYALRMIQTTTYLYVGEASPGTEESSEKWRVKRISISDPNNLSILWADGNQQFDNIWANYATLTYA